MDAVTRAVERGDRWLIVEVVNSQSGIMRSSPIPQKNGGLCLDARRIWIFQTKKSARNMSRTEYNRGDFVEVYGNIGYVIGHTRDGSVKVVFEDGMQIVDVKHCRGTGKNLPIHKLLHEVYESLGKGDIE